MASSSNQGLLSTIKAFFVAVVEKIKKIIGLGTPTAHVSGIHIISIDLKKVDMIYDVLIVNPSRITFPLLDVSYLADSDGRKLVSGTITDAGALQANASSTIKVAVTLVYENILSTLGDIRPGSIIPYRFRVGFMVKIPIFGKVTVPLEKSGEIPIPSMPLIILEQIQFEKFGFDESVTVLHLKMQNKNEFELGLKALEYELGLSGVKIGSAELAQSAKIDKSGISLIKIPLSFRPKDFGSALWKMMGETAVDYSLQGSVSVDTTFGPMNLPFSKEGSVSLLGTNRLPHLSPESLLKIKHRIGI